ncbi:MAG: isochorismate synthase [Rubrobacteraceae bacterium]
MLSRDYKGLIPESGGAFWDSPEHARWTLADLVSRTLSRDSASLEGDAQAARLEVPVGRADLFGWLGEQQTLPKLYWSGRGSGREGSDGFEVAALGVADLHESPADDPADVRKLLSNLLVSGDPRLRYYGGLRFDAGRTTEDEWTSFGSYRFILPRFELRICNEEAVLACNLVLPRDAANPDEILEEIENLSFGVQTFEESLPKPVSRTDEPGFAAWRKNVGRVLTAFDEGRLGKVVLARRAEFGFEEDLDPVLIAAKLKAATPDCFHFYIEPEPGSAFVGASPERLYRREDRTIMSEAVAGTRPRGNSETYDEDLRDELLESEKDRAEHGYVRDSIREALGSLCRTLEADECMSEMKLTRRRHLVSGILGELREGVSDADILEALHPTPAVGGYPKQEALREIRELEAFDRGWYAGPVGWIGAAGAEFAVGIRSGLVTGRNLSLYSGAGIVSGSNPEQEWAEIEQKISDFTKIFGLGARNIQG